MGGVKQVIVVRRDLKLRRSELAAAVASAATRFFLDNDESDHTSRLEVNLSKTESHWLSDEEPKYVVVGVPSRNAMERVLFRADVAGIPSYSVVRSARGPESEKEGYTDEVVAAALGPDLSEDLDKITGKLKLL